MPIHLLLALLAAGDPQTITVVSTAPKKICRESEAVVGTHIRSGRRCKTAEEWQLEDQGRSGRPTTMRLTTGQGDGTVQPTRPQ